jgi:hypothetical protein
MAEEHDKEHAPDGKAPSDGAKESSSKPVTGKSVEEIFGARDIPKPDYTAQFPPIIVDKDGRRLDGSGFTIKKKLEPDE